MASAAINGAVGLQAHYGAGNCTHANNQRTNTLYKGLIAHNGL